MLDDVVPVDALAMSTLPGLNAFTGASSSAAGAGQPRVDARQPLRPTVTPRRRLLLLRL
jgi:hypothetical protein